MKPIKQTITELGKGNCLAACFASILEVDIDEIPDLKRGENFTGLQEYLAKKNLTAIWLYIKDLSNYYIGYEPKYCILIGKSPRNTQINHAVVAKPNGYGYIIVHDPHPDGGNLAEDPSQVIYIGAKLY